MEGVATVVADWSTLSEGEFLSQLEKDKEMEDLSSTLKRTIWIEKKKPMSDRKAEESEEEDDNDAEEGEGKEKEEKEEPKDSAGTISLPTTTI